MVWSKESQLYLSLVSLNVLAWALGLHCLELPPGLTLDAGSDAQFSWSSLLPPALCILLLLGKGSTRSVEGRSLFTWGFSAKTKWKLGYFEYVWVRSVLSSVSQRNLWPFVSTTFHSPTLHTYIQQKTMSWSSLGNNHLALESNYRDSSITV